MSRNLRRVRGLMRGDDVREVCARLVDLGHLEHVRDVYDHTLATAVRRFQEFEGLSHDGIVGPMTRASLELAQALSLPKLDALPTETGYAEGQAVLGRGLHYLLAGASEEGRSNRGSWVDHFLGPKGKRGAWCNGFVETCVQEALDEEPFNQSIWVTATYIRARQGGFFRFTPQGARIAEAYESREVDPARIDPGYAMLPGDAFVQLHFDDDHDPLTWKGWLRPGHIGLVHHLERPYYYSCEGNAGSYPAEVGCLRRPLERRDLLGYIRWNKELLP